MSGKIYGYCRISTSKQSVLRQERNILAVYPAAIIIKEVYTGTKFQGREQLDKLLRTIKSGDTLVFDSVSRMSRNEYEGFELYEKLFRKNINLIFLKEPLINSETYRKAMANQLEMTGDKVDLILEGINRYLMELAKEQIRIAFAQAQKEVDDLRERTKEGIETARLAGKQIGRKSGTTFETKKSIKAKQEILKKSKSFGGTYTDKDLIKIIGIAKNSYYKYKKELQEVYL